MTAVNSFDIKKYKSKLGQDVAIFKVGHFVDVFVGKDGFNSHTRFTTKRTNKGLFLDHHSGYPLPNSAFKFVVSEVNK